MIEVSNLTKRFGATTAVDDISFTVQPGKVTGFLGPNGAGKTTTMRAIAGLDLPTAGTSSVNGNRMNQHAFPMHELGVLLDANHIHHGRTAQAHLEALAATHGIGTKRVHEVLDLTGLADVARRRAGTFSLGMRQRLGIAAALLGDPASFILDEPINGLDPDGVVWVRTLLRRLAGEGRTVFLSSHLMSEMAQTADHLIVIGRGRLITDSSIQDVLGSGTDQSRVLVRATDPDRLAEALAAPGITVTRTATGGLEVTGLEAAAVSGAAAALGILLHELTTSTASLEEAYLSLTRSAVEYQTAPENQESTP
ncbi:ATP-binding cassette domain-containing protein [Arthrobacter sp. EH-1B-1]|uniref:ATP-binding cassette domain-containing protein n=1 Tax=Arthrobacter vasquezii TaxID=2977629 RepID=A0ABT6CQW6_9MICC|nr:ATP-binding cassette domain-containing protein [Arthrobacter vasquezii]MDF9276211.1 ATP-binding cassette domain-containing protein [Arthrobacter vasquezii]